MATTRAIGSFATLVFVVAAAVSAGDPPPPVGSPSQSAYLTETMYRVFGVSEQEGSSRDALVRAIRTIDGPIEGRDGAIDNLVAEISRGLPPRETLSTKYDFLDVSLSNGFKTDTKRWPYGTDFSLDALNMHLLTRAREAKKQEPDRAARYVRAIVILLCENDGLFGPLGGASILDNPEFRDLLHLDKAQSKTLDDCIATARNEAGADRDRHAKLDHVVSQIDERENDPISKEGVGSVVAQAKDSVNLARSPFCRLSAVSEVFKLRRILMIRNDAEMQKVLRTLVQDWIDHEKDRRITRWLDQSINMTTDPVTERAQAHKFFPG